MNICLVGYGIIGREWAQHYRADGFQLKIWNRTPQHDVAEFTADLPTAAAEADVLHVVVADPPAVAGVLEQTLPVLPPGALIIQSSTISPRWAEEFSARAASAQRLYVEAPFTGSKLAAQDRKNVFYLGGDPAAKEQAKTVLHGLSSRCFDVGTVQQAAALKLAMNLQIASIALALNESLTMARQAGIPDDLFFAVLELNVARSGLSDLKKPKLLQTDYSPQFSVKHMAKDLRLALETSSHAPLTHAASAIFEQGIQAGLGDDDFIGLIRLLHPADPSSPKTLKK